MPSSVVEYDFFLYVLRLRIPSLARSIYLPIVVAKYSFCIVNFFLKRNSRR